MWRVGAPVFSKDAGWRTHPAHKFYAALLAS
jgi:hypothetical protein